MKPYKGGNEPKPHPRLQSLEDQATGTEENIYELVDFADRSLEWTVCVLCVCVCVSVCVSVRAGVRVRVCS